MFLLSTVDKLPFTKSSKQDYGVNRFVLERIQSQKTTTFVGLEWRGKITMVYKPSRTETSVLIDFFSHIS